MSRRVAITGAGVRTAIGDSVESFWNACQAGRSRVAPIPQRWLRFAGFRSRIWSPLAPPGPLLADAGRVARQQHDPVALLALGAARDALVHSGRTPQLVDQRHQRSEVPGLDPARAGVWMGTGIGGASSFLENHATHLLERPRRTLQRDAHDDAQHREVLDDLAHARRFNPFVVPMLMPNTVSATLGIKFSLTGPNVTAALACASGTVAIGQAFRALRAGRVDVALAGGAEFLDDAHGAIFRGFDVAGALVRDCDQPQRANRPFDRLRNGFLFSQGGAAVLVLEDLERARARGARVLAEIAGFGESFDAFSPMAIEPSGVHIDEAVLGALDDARADAHDVGYVNAHGTGTVANDETEAAVIDRLFGNRVVVAATKSLLGHTFGAAGAIEAVVTALTLDRQRTHGCLNLDDPVRPLGFARAAGPIEAEVGVTQSFGFGGHNAVLALRRASPPGG